MKVPESAGQIAYLHHETTTDSVEGVGGNAGSSCDSLCHGPLGKEVGGLLILEEHALGCVVQTKVGSTVHDNTLQQQARLQTCKQAARTRLRNMPTIQTSNIAKSKMSEAQWKASRQHPQNHPKRSA